MQDCSAMVPALVATLGMNEFERVFYESTRALFRNEQCNVFVLHEDKPAECMLTYAAQREIRALTRKCVSLYLAQGIGADPLLPEMRRSGGQVARMLSGRDISDDLYRERFYDRAAVHQKIATLARINGKVFYLNFYREPGKPDFSAADRDLLGEIGGVLCSFLAKHYELTHHETPISKPRVSLEPEFRAQLAEQVRSALLAEGVGLTDREAEICAAIAIGQSGSGIASELGISLNTVATHRKRAYAKLEISSQSELFARYYECLTNRVIGVGMRLLRAG